MLRSRGRPGGPHLTVLRSRGRPGGPHLTVLRSRGRPGGPHLTVLRSRGRPGGPHLTVLRSQGRPGGPHLTVLRSRGRPGGPHLTVLRSRGRPGGPHLTVLTFSRDTAAVIRAAGSLPPRPLGGESSVRKTRALHPCGFLCEDPTEQTWTRESWCSVCHVRIHVLDQNPDFSIRIEVPLERRFSLQNPCSPTYVSDLMFSH